MTPERETQLLDILGKLIGLVEKDIARLEGDLAQVSDGLVDVDHRLSDVRREGLATREVLTAMQQDATPAPAKQPTPLGMDVVHNLAEDTFALLALASEPLWNEMSALGWCDSWGGTDSEWLRVFSATLAFVHEQANLAPSDRAAYGGDHYALTDDEWDAIERRSQ